LKGAIIVNPFDQVEVAEGLDQALRMPLLERQERWRRLMNALTRNDLATWSDSYLDTLNTSERVAA
jgi:trehalose 6-phosphate synthase